MTVLDAYAVIGFLRGERCADEVAKLLRSPATLPSVNAAEVVDQLVRVFGHDLDDVHADIELLVQAGVSIEPLSSQTALLAGQLRARHYHRDRCAVSLADCVAAASALTAQLPLATSDPALATVVRSEGGDVHGLRDSKGKRP